MSSSSLISFLIFFFLSFFPSFFLSFFLRYGIPAGLKVKILWVYLSRAFVWEQALKDPVVRSLAVPARNASSRWDPRQTPKTGVFKNFPHWDDVFDLHQNAQAANLLGDMSAWVVKKNAPLFQELLQHAEKET